MALLTMFSAPGLASLGLRVCAMCAPRESSNGPERRAWAHALVAAIWVRATHGVTILIDQDGIATPMEASEVAAFRWCCANLTLAQRDARRGWKWTEVIASGLWFSDTLLLNPGDESFLLGAKGLGHNSSLLGTVECGGACCTLPPIRTQRTPIDAARMVAIAAATLGGSNADQSALTPELTLDFFQRYDDLDAEEGAQCGDILPRVSGLKLLWRASRDGFDASEFHARCDGKGATLTVILRDGVGAKERARAELLLDTIEPPLSPRSRESLRRSRYCPPRSIVGGYSDRDWTPSTLATGT